MQSIELCSFCSNVYGRPPTSGTCTVCQNKLAILDELLTRAISHLAKTKENVISFSTKIPKSWLVKEELAFDQKLGKASIKSGVNHYIARTLENSGFKISVDPRTIVTFDLEAGALSYEPGDLFVFGRYFKHVKGLSQSRWVCNSCSGKGCNACNSTGSNYLSVEELIGIPLKEATKSTAYVLHASGREDVDVTNSAGRAFVIELPKAMHLPNLEVVTNAIARDGQVSVSDLAIVPRSFSEVVTESHFDKEYLAHVSVEGGMEGVDLEQLNVLKGCVITQRTPVRVAHRRADLDRKRTVLAYTLESQSKEGFTIRLLTEPGTYIKELISGDGGRTNPSISGMLGKKCVCASLEVTAIHDEALDACSKSG